MGVAEIRVVEDGHAVDLWGRLSEFPAAGPSPFVVKAGLVPSAVTQYVGLCRRLDPDCSIAVHAAGGVVFARFSDSAAGEISGEFVRRLQPLAVNCGGEAVVLASAAAGELTRQMVWGGRGDAAAVVAAVKRKFDPRGILNPGRFNFVAHEP